MAATPNRPEIENCLRTGYPDGKDPVYPKCPICGHECETIYYDKNKDPFACDVCLRMENAWDEPACFPDGR